MAAVPSIGRAARVEGGLAPEADLTRALYEQYANQIFRYCLHQLGSREEAEDAVQSTFLNAFRGIKRGVVPELESAWLFKIAHNVCLSRRRTSWRRGRVESPTDFGVVEELTPAPSRRSDELIGLQDVLGQLPENQRRAILLREWQGLSYREIAEELDLSQAAVETLIFRARRALASGLEQPPAAKRRVVRGSDLGNILAGLKSLLLGGGAAVKVAATVAVVSASTVVAAAPIQHHRVHTRPAPKPTTAGPAQKAAAPARGTSATSVAGPAAAFPAKHAARARAHKTHVSTLAHGGAVPAAAVTAPTIGAAQAVAPADPTPAAPAPVDPAPAATPTPAPAPAAQDTSDAKKDPAPAQTNAASGNAGTKTANDSKSTKTTGASGSTKTTGDSKAGDSDQRTSSSGGSSTATTPVAATPITGTEPVVQMNRTTPLHITGPVVIPLAPTTAAQYPTAQTGTTPSTGSSSSGSSSSSGASSSGSSSSGSSSSGSQSSGSSSSGSSGSSQGGAGTVTTPVVTTPPASTTPVVGSRGSVAQPVVSNPGLSISGGATTTNKNVWGSNGA